MELALQKLEGIELQQGSHSSPEKGMCVMEAVAFVAGEPFSDHPSCSSPIIASFLRSWNDTLNTADRNRLLKPLIPFLIGTVASDAIELKRGWMLIDWLIRGFTPPWFRLAKLNEVAAALEAVTEVDSIERVEAAMRVITVAKQQAAAAGAAAGAAAWAAAGAAAWAAAGDAAWDSAWAAAWAAAGAAARDAAWAAAGAAAWAAAGDAAGDAAGKKLRPTVEEVQASAVELVKRMCQVK